MRRYELTDEQWEKISDLFPDSKGQRGGQWKDHRIVLNGMFWVLGSGAPWRDLPERYGSWKTVYDRFRRYRIEGAFDKILARLQLELNAEGLIDLCLWQIDSTTVRAHKSAAGAGLKKGDQVKEGEPENHALGRSRGGFTSKIHLVSDSNSLPLAAVLSSGAAHDAAYFHPVLEQVKIPVERGRKRTRPEEVVADKAYDAGHLRKKLARRGIKAMIPERQLRSGTKRRKKGPHFRFDKETYKKRASVEQSIGWLKQYRRIATRYEKLAVSFMAMLKLAFIKFYLKKHSSDTA